MVLKSRFALQMLLKVASGVRYPDPAADMANYFCCPHFLNWGLKLDAAVKIGFLCFDHMDTQQTNSKQC